METSRGVTPPWSPSRSQQRPAAITYTERQERVCGCVSRAQRLPSSEEAIVAPPVTHQHTSSNARTRQSKTKEKKRMTPRADSAFTYGEHRAAASTGLQQNRKSIPAVHCANNYVCWRSRREEEHREAHQHSKRHSWMAAIHAVRPNPHNHARWQHTPNQRKEKKKTRRQGVAVCVALRVSASPDRKENKTRGKEMCAPPHRPSSHAHTSRLPQRAVLRGPSSCVQQARRTGPSS
ncbi:hypothetical protein TcCL_Unassigned05032 [Trypanosoma cruzi]|nr:hypothetical protein TcCL_Unassigned05032 [Trypanosoma cruzi]